MWKETSLEDTKTPTCWAKSVQELCCLIEKSFAIGGEIKAHMKNLVSNRLVGCILFCINIQELLQRIVNPVYMYLPSIFLSVLAGGFEAHLSVKTKQTCSGQEHNQLAE